jgi:hypothetical protein
VVDNAVDGGAVAGAAVDGGTAVSVEAGSPGGGSDAPFAPNGHQRKPVSSAPAVRARHDVISTTRSNAHAVGRIAVHASRKVWPGRSYSSAEQEPATVFDSHPESGAESRDGSESRGKLSQK